MKKHCTSCGQLKKTSEFYSLPHTTDGLNWRCIPCQNEYNRQYNLKRTLAKCHPATLEAFKAAPLNRLRRFAPKVLVTETCWHWTGNRHPNSGYARVWFDKHDDRLAHRVAYEWAKGPIPNRLTLDHLCRVRHCVNPAHLEPVTNAENVLRGMSPAAQNARKTCCKDGHEFSPENTKIMRNGSRRCRICSRAWKKARRQKHSSMPTPPARASTASRDRPSRSGHR